MRGIKKMDQISNQAVYKAVEKNQFILQIQQRQLLFIGHSLRRDPNDQINKYVLYTPGKLINNDMPPTAVKSC